MLQLNSNVLFKFKYPDWDKAIFNVIHWGLCLKVFCAPPPHQHSLSFTYFDFVKIRKWFSKREFQHRFCSKLFHCHPLWYKKAETHQDLLARQWTCFPKGISGQGNKIKRRFYILKYWEKISWKQLIPLREPGLAVWGDGPVPHDCTPALTQLQLIRKADLKYRSKAFLIIFKNNRFAAWNEYSHRTKPCRLLTTH